MQKALIVLGVIIVLIGLAWPWLRHLPLGQLPGDIAIERQSYKVYFPITTMILISVVLSAVMWFFRR